MEPYPRTWVDIDLGAMAANLQWLRGRVSESFELALVVKADAYGHGLVPVGRFAVRNGADWLCVATVQEGVALREAGVESRIMVMSPILGVEAEQAVFYQLDVFVESFEMGKVLGKAGLMVKRAARIHLKVDTGLHRFGVGVVGAVDVAKELKGVEGLELVGIGHHFVDSAKDLMKTLGQREVFRQLVNQLAEIGIGFEYVHEGNSAAVGSGDALGNIGRCGIFAYGVDPYGVMGGKESPVMTWKARITSLRDVEAGDTLSYSSTHRVERRSRIATLGVGYGDGYGRCLSNKGEVWVHGVRCPVVGLVCMDQTLVDVSGVDDVVIGDTVELFGRNIRVPEVAAACGTNSHEVLTRVMTRVSRRYIYPSG